jgi:pseudaminic acid synthase
MIIGNFNFAFNRTFIIAELSANHHQSFDIAVKTIEAAKDAGVDAVKLQTYTPDTITIDCDNEYFQIKYGTVWDGKTLYDLYKEAYTPWEWQPKLKTIAEELGLELFSSPFDNTAVDFLEEMNVPAYKIASFEITDIPLIEYAASKGKPMIISTGIASLPDIEEALNACRRMNNNNIALLKCTSSYPAPIEEANLLTIPDMKEKFGVIAGLSDHTLTNTTAIAAVSLGARIVEKHIILNKYIGGPDAGFSLEPNEFKELVRSIRETERALGNISYELTEKTKNNKVFSRSLFVVKDISKGEVITGENVKSIRPYHGLPTKHYKDVLGKKAKHNISRGTPLSMDLIE